MHRIVIKNIRQVKTIRDVLHMERQRFLSELIKTNLQIQARKNYINRVFSYLTNLNFQAFVQTGGAKPSLQVVSQKMLQHIILEQWELAKLAVIDRALSERIRNIDRKIILMSMFENTSKSLRSTI